ncbi:MAG: response regulator [Acidobacteria bacterium]|nr:response regulator [Acidobacteriota bacterium]NIM61619.1 response regulator [Acidobacteriota bacterium]NIO58883.1 response regulator [Acidobacteriota bacterium]NIQ29934.1 response regulator [Acidobacteriota bacterium]NIQ87427.1 response regulator [Acidobacteriota bacterium]
MAKTQPKDRRFFTTTEVARYCEVSNDGVLKWIKSGKLRAFSTPGGHYRVSAEDFREFLKLYAFPIQESFFGTETSAARTRRVLVVDDEPDQREILVRLLSKIDPDWVVDQAADGYEAGIKIGMNRPDLVVLDIMMPKVDGLSLCRTIRSNQETRSIRILAITGEPGKKALALEAGADVCLIKPVGFERLRHELSSLLGRRRPRSTRRPRQQA